MVHGPYRDTTTNHSEATLSYIPKHILKIAFDTVTFSIPISLYNAKRAYSFRSTFVSEMVNEFKTIDHIKRMDKRFIGEVRTLIDEIRIQNDEWRKEYVVTLRVPIPANKKKAYTTAEYRDSFRRPTVKIERCDGWMIDSMSCLLTRIGLPSILSKVEFSYNFIPREGRDCRALFRYLESIVHVKWGSRFRSYLDYSVLLFGGRNRRVKLYMRERGKNSRRKRYIRLEMTFNSGFLRRRGIRYLEDLREIKGMEPLGTLSFGDDAYFSVLRRRLRGRCFGRHFEKGTVIVDGEPFLGELGEYFVTDWGGWDVVENLYERNVSGLGRVGHSGEFHETEYEWMEEDGTTTGNGRSSSTYSVASIRKRN